MSFPYRSYRMNKAKSSTYNYRRIERRTFSAKNIRCFRGMQKNNRVTFGYKLIIILDLERKDSSFSDKSY